MCACCPSPTPRGLGLGPTNPELIISAQETLGLRCGRFTRPFAATYTGIRSSHPSSGALAPPSQDRGNAPLPTPYTSPRMGSAASAADLAPLDCRRAATRPVSYYALFQGWLLLSQPPGCLSRDTSFTTESVT